MKVAVVGGGIAGLAAARRLEAIVPSASVLLVERDAVLGGKIRTAHVGGFLVEAAPDSFLARKERGVGLCEELGLGDELIGRKPEHHRTFVRLGGRLHPLPEGLTGAIPTNLDALDATELLSPEAKRRFASEREVPAVAGNEDESIGAFVSRRFGREAYEALVEPLLTGIYGGDGDLLSLEATFPQLRVLEVEHGSVLGGLSSGPAGGGQPFLSLRNGMGSLVERLVASLERTEVLSGRTARGLRRGSEGYELALEGGQALEVDAVVVATPAYATSELLADLDAELAEALAEIPHASSVVVTLGFSRADVTLLDGYGYVVPRAEGTDVLACTWTSQKWEGRAPDDGVLVRVYAGRFGGHDLTAWPDDELVGLAREEVLLLGIEAQPTMTRIDRWTRGMPQYVLGHLERVERIESALAEHPGLGLAGAAYRGVGIPDCIRSGELAAESVARALAGART